MKISCRGCTGGYFGITPDRERRKQEWGPGLGPEELSCFPDPTGSSWGWMVLQSGSPWYLTQTSHWMQAGPEGSVALGKSAPVGRGQFLERDMTERLQQPTLLAAVGASASVLKGGSGWYTPTHHTEFPGLIIFISIHKKQCSLNSG